ncbi:MAG: family 43 glycosylhydrolase [Prolixibacteraceae bacterium]|nr:family 43 glycosylhydrolase [Prolixibacteraceae bacterium]
MKLFLPLLVIFVSFNFARGGTSDSLSATLDSYIESQFPSMPLSEVLINYNVQDVSVTTGPARTYYLTGTSGDINGVQQGIRVWASNDLQNWNFIGFKSDYIWTFEDDAEDWQKEIIIIDGMKKRGIMAPEIHFINDTFFISYTNSNSGNAGILRSMSGRPQGPYQEISGEKPLIKASHTSLFQDTDNTVYFIWGNGKVLRMMKDMSGFSSSSSARPLTFSGGNQPEIFGLHVELIDDKYFLSGSQYISNSDSKMACLSDARVNGVVYKADNFWGPYHKITPLIPHGGGGHLLKAFNDSLYYLTANPSATNPTGSYPGIFALSKHSKGFSFKSLETKSRKQNQQVIYVSRMGNNSSGDSWDNAYTSIQRAIDNALLGAQIWIATGYYYDPVMINLWNGLQIYGGFAGWEKSLNERDSDMNRVIINGRQKVQNMVTIKVSRNIYIDGVTIRGGNASGKSNFGQYGAGVHVLGGGETIKFVNCRFEDNKAELDGGAVYASLGASPIFINCTFAGNIAYNNGGAIAAYGNSTNGYSLKFYNCTFSNNQSEGDGSTIFFDSNTRGHGFLHIVNSLFENNRSYDYGGTIKTGGYASVMIQNSIFCFNKGIQNGASILSTAGIPAKSSIINSIFYKNSGGTLISIEGDTETVSKDDKIWYRNIWMNTSNCLFYDNEVNSLTERRFDREKWKSVESLNSSPMGKNCISANPDFVDEAQSDFRLKSNSPARNKGISTCFFKYNMNMQKRNSSGINIGCY